MKDYRKYGKGGLKRNLIPTKNLGWRVDKTIPQCGEEVSRILAVLFNEMWDELSAKQQTKFSDKYNEEITLVQKVLPLGDV